MPWDINNMQDITDITTDVLAYSDTLGNSENVTVTRWFHTVSLYPDIFYYKRGQLGIWRSVTVTRWLYTVSL